MILVPSNMKSFHWKALLFSLIWLLPSCNDSPKGNSHQGLHVPEGFTIESATTPGLVSFVYFATLDDQGRLFVFESDGRTTSTEEMTKNPSFRIRRLEDQDGDGVFDKAITYADKIPFPMGGDFHQGSLYVAAPPNLIKFTDRDGDGVADDRETLLSGWVFYHNAAILSGPFIGPDGWLYLCDARRGFDIQTKEGDTLKGKSARIWRCKIDGTGLEPVSGGGFDNTIELIFMPSGETIGTMTYYMDPQGGQRDALMHWVEGGTYPKPHPVIEADKLVLTGELMPVMTKFARVSPTGLMRYEGNSWGAAYAGNLFSTQFNTGRIMRHTIVPDGATFRTLDEPFLTSSVADIHPTDALQDGDGSLLIVDTGGWFIAGCPLSQVAKSNVPGGIYRIRKVGTAPVDDPWGKQLDFKAMAPEQLMERMNDPRPTVRDKALEHLVIKGDAAVESLKKILLDSKQEDVRASSVFALYRINTPLSISSIHPALNDQSAVVRTAACRVLGLAKDREAIDKLMDMVQNDHAPVRRQAATALEQIGDKKAVSALLNASSNPNDRHVEHAIIHALIALGEAPPLLTALNHESVKVRKAALIALDQMKSAPLRKEHLASFLSSADSTLLHTGLWATKHHPDWPDLVTHFVEPYCASKKSIGGMEASLRDLMVPFAAHPHMQNFIAQQLGNPTVPTPMKSLLMEVIGQSNVKDLPNSWVRLIGNLLKDNDVHIRTQALGLIDLRGINQLNKELTEVIQNPSTSAPIRLKALEARIKYSPQLSESEFQLILKFLDKSNEPPIRQLAAQLLAHAETNNGQLLIIARNHLKSAEPFLLPSLVNVFMDNGDEEVGKALVAALQSSEERLDNLSVPNMKKLLEAYPASVRDMAVPLMKTLEAHESERLSRLQQVESTLGGGDVDEGRKLFFGKATCSSCHGIDNKGGRFGPDLTNIGEIRSRHDILEAILYPNVSFAREYETFKVVTKTGEYTGIVLNPLPESITVSTGPGTEVRLSRTDIVSIDPDHTSMMPTGLDKLLTPVEMSNLMAFLETLPDGLGQLSKKSK